jgi:hypothetical protein
MSPMIQSSLTPEAGRRPRRAERATARMAAPPLAAATLFAVVLACGTASPRPSAAAPADARVFSDAGNIYIDRDGVRTRLTRSEMDVDPTLSPDGTVVVYTRQGRGRTPRGYDSDPRCSTEPRPDEMRLVNADGSSDRLLLTGRTGAPQSQLCDFRGKQFSADGRRVFFLTPGSMMSGALHVFDIRTGDERFLLPANDVLVLNFCTNKYKDALAVLQRRPLLFGGSFDWYWLYDPSAKKELGALGPFSSPEDMLRQAHGVWCESRS